MEEWHRASITSTSIQDDFMKFDYAYAKPRRDDTYAAVFESVHRDFSADKLLIPLTTGAAAKHPDFPKPSIITAKHQDFPSYLLVALM